MLKVVSIASAFQQQSTNGLSARFSGFSKLW